MPPENPICETKSKRARHGISEWFKIEKGVSQGCILSPCLFNSYVEYITRNAWLDESQVELRLSEISIVSDTQVITTLMTVREEELNSLLIKVKEESEKAGLNSTFKKLRSWHLVSSVYGKQKGKKWKQ